MTLIKDRDLLEGFDTVRVYLKKRMEVCDSYARIRHELERRREFDERDVDYVGDGSLAREYDLLDEKIKDLQFAFGFLKRDMEYLSNKGNV